MLFLQVIPHVAELCPGAVFQSGWESVFSGFSELKRNNSKVLNTKVHKYHASITQHTCLDFFSILDLAILKEKESIRTLGSESFSLVNGSGDRVVQAHVST